MHQLRKKKILPIVLLSMVEAENFSKHPRIITMHGPMNVKYIETFSYSTSVLQ